MRMKEEKQYISDKICNKSTYEDINISIRNFHFHFSHAFTFLAYALIQSNLQLSN